MITYRDWLAIPHQKLYDDIHGGPGHTGHEAARLNSAALGNALKNAYTRLNDALRDLGASWEGEAADRATGKIGALRTWTGAVGEFTLTLSEDVANQMDSFVHARNSMPEPVDTTLHWNSEAFEVSWLTDDQEAVDAKAREAHQEAARVMNDYAAAVDSSAALYPEPPQIGAEEGGPGGRTPTPVNPAAPKPRALGGGDLGEGSSFNAGPQDGAYRDHPPKDGHAAEEIEHDRAGGGFVERTSYTPPATTGGGALGPLAAGGGVLGVGGGAPGVSGGIGGLGGSFAALPHSGASGHVPTQPGPRGPVPPRVVGQAPRPGGGSTFMQPALAGGKGEEDKEHQRQYEITEDIVGELPMVAPPVIGE